MLLPPNLANAHSCTDLPQLYNWLCRAVAYTGQTIQQNLGTLIFAGACIKQPLLQIILHIPATTAVVFIRRTV